MVEDPRKTRSGSSIGDLRMVFGIGTGVEPLAEGAGHLLKTGSERMGGEENRTGARVRAACGALLLTQFSTIVLRGLCAVDAVAR